MASMAGGAPTIQIPRWIQLVGLPLLALLIWFMASQVVHAVFIFLVAGLIALLLNPLVRAISRLWIPRGFSIAIVYLSFAAAVTVVIFAIGLVVIDQSQSAADRIENYLTVEDGQTGQTGFEQGVDNLQLWLDDHGLERVDVREQGDEIATDFKNSDVEKYTTQAIDFIRGAAISIFGLILSLILVVVVSVYMLLDMGRLTKAADRRFPPPEGTPGLVIRMEQALAGYVRGQLLVSLTIGASVGVGMWLLGTLGLVARGGQVRGALRRLRGGHGAHPLPRAGPRARFPRSSTASWSTPSRPCGSSSSTSGSIRSRATSSCPS